MVYMLINLAVSAYIIGNVASLMTKQDERTALLRERLVDLKRYEEHNELPPALIESMRQYIATQQNQQDQGAGGAFEATFPMFIAARARYLRHRPLIYAVPLFAGGANGGDMSRSEHHFLTAVTSRAVEEVLMDGLRVLEVRARAFSRRARESRS